jgi:hypothetical protein
MKRTLTSLVFFMAISAFGQTFKSEPTIVITKPVEGNLYVSGVKAIVNAPVHGDLVVGGGVVEVNDSVSNDLLAAGGRVYLRSWVGQDIRCAGGYLEIGTPHANEVIASGGKVHLLSSATVDVFSATGGNVIIDGVVNKVATVTCSAFRLNGKVLGDAELRGANLTINGSIGGNVQIAATESIVITEYADLSRVVKYWTPINAPLRLPARLHSHPTVYDPLLSITYSKWYFLGATNFLGFLWYMSMTALIIALLEYLFRQVFTRSARYFRGHPARSGLYGVGFVVGVPLVAIILLATIIAIPLGLLLAAGYIGVLILATIISAMILTHVVQEVSMANWSYWKMVGVGMFLYVLLKIIWLTPFFGKPLWGVIVCMSLGSMMFSIHIHRRSRSQRPPENSMELSNPRSALSA